MQVIIKRRFQIILDEDEAEEFLDDPLDVQSKVRAQLYAPKENGHTGTTDAAPRAPMARVAPPVPVTRGRPKKQSATYVPSKAKRPAVQPVTCKDCGEKMDPRVLWRHERKHAAEAAGAE